MMSKYNMLLPILLCFVLNLQAKEDSIRLIDSKVEAVTIFLGGGGQVTRTAKVTLEKGVNSLLFQDVATSLYNDHIEVVKNDNYSFVNLKRNQRKPSTLSAAKKAELEKQKENLTQKLKHEQILLKLYVREERLLKNHENIKGSNETLKASDLEAFLNLQFQRSLELAKKKKEATKKLNNYDEQIRVIYKQQESNNATNNVLVKILADKAKEATITLRYIVNNCGWQPMYTIKAKDVSTPLAIVYEADVYQQAAEKWEDVQLTLSTANIQKSTTPRNLRPLYLAIPRQSDTPWSYQLQSRPYMPPTQKPKPNSQFHVAIKENQTNTVYEVKTPYTLNPSGEHRRVAIGDYEIPAIYEYTTTPKAEKTTFLHAKIPDWNSNYFLSGQAKLYFEEIFIGTTNINTQTIKDTLVISLGSDNNITTKVQTTTKFNKKKVIGDFKVEARGYELSVRNNKSQEILIVVKDQIPVSQDSEIEVKNIDYKKAILNEKTGELKWIMKIPARTTKKVEFSYKVKYPKDISLNVGGFYD